MKVTLAFLPKVVLNKIMDSFALKLRLFVCLFSFIFLLVLYFKAFYCTGGFNFASTDFEKNILLAQKMLVKSRNFGHLDLIYNQ